MTTKIETSPSPPHPSTNIIKLIIKQNNYRNEPQSERIDFGKPIFEGTNSNTIIETKNTKNTLSVAMTNEILNIIDDNKDDIDIDNNNLSTPMSIVITP
eukprot:383462_1